MRDFSHELEMIEILVNTDGDQSLTLLSYMNALQTNDEFLSQSRPYEDFILKSNFRKMAAQTQEGRPIDFEKIEFFRADKYQFLFGMGHSADMKITALFFLFQKSGRGLMHCLNHVTGNGILGPFDFQRDVNSPYLGEISLN